ncbi:hypothetical protein CHK_0663 [Christensenella hongkongensis]|uniref:Uncharacterized protein n=1 Tax=Christensenella hongkongensis TaxID=270498 RepID=A0A0M2NNQ7_9FIRM|nr:hypothetical protein CHK_0663 [Christensenella hongkongensis]
MDFLQFSGSFCEAKQNFLNISFDEKMRTRAGSCKREC